MKPGIESKLIIPGGNKAIPVREIEVEFIYHLIKEKNLKKTLEIGFGYGRSAAYIMRATNARHIVIDPFQENYDSLGLKNIQKIDQDTRPWFHFKEFYTLRSLISHHLISYLNQGDDGFFKSMLVKLKWRLKSKS